MSRDRPTRSPPSPWSGPSALRRRDADDGLRERLSLADRPVLREDEDVPEEAVVELDIFSGMPDPVWSLSEKDTLELARRLARLPTAEHRELSTNLGYRGLVVRHVRSDGETRIIRVQRGLVEVRAGRTVRHYADPGRHLERDLLRSGASALGPEVLAAVEQDLSG